MKENTNLYYHQEVITVDKKNNVDRFYVQLKNISSQKPDVKLGSYNNNLWYRLAKACKKDFAGYNNEKQLEKAIKLCLLKRGYIDVTFVIKD